MKVLLTFIFFVAFAAWALETPPPVESARPAQQEPEDDSIIKYRPFPADKPKVVSAVERAKICAKYNGKFIGYYDDVYKVDGCKRRMVTRNEDVYAKMRGGAEIIEVQGAVIAAIPEGAPIQFMEAMRRNRSCKELEGHYITYSYGDVFYVERCKRRAIPDWETYNNHRRDKFGAATLGSEIQALTWEEFSAIQPGEPMASLVSKDYAKQSKEFQLPQVDIIPIDEACKPVEGKFVSFYSRIYRIEKCRKREIDPEIYSKQMSMRGSDAKFVELLPEQWVSIPDGKPYDVK